MILVTGASGFIGRNLVEHLDEVLCPPHEELDLLDETAVDEYFAYNNIDIIVHCATKPGHRYAKDPTGLIVANTGMFFNLAKQKFDKMIVIGSGAVYDQRHYQPKMKESYFGESVPIDQTGHSKYIISQHILKTPNMYDLRCFGVFGKYEEHFRFITHAIIRATENNMIDIEIDRKMSYLCIDDLCRIVEHFIYNDMKHRAYNIVPDIVTSISILAQLVNWILKKDCPILINDYGDEYSGDNSLLRRELPGFAFTPTDVAIEELVRWYKNEGF